MANVASVNPLPAANDVVDESRRVTLAWLQFFQQQYSRVTGIGNFLYAGTANQVLHGDPLAPTWSAVDLAADITGVLPVAHGGTASSTALSGNSIMVSNGSAIVQGAKGTTTTVLHGNAAGSPTYAAVSLVNDITGTLLPANGGTGITSLGTGVATALGVNTGTAGSFVVNGGALGTPSSGTVTNLTGTASISINGTVGATTPNTGTFTTLTGSTSIRALAANGYLSSDNSAGISTTVTTASLVGKTITFKDGLITAFA